MRKRQVSRNWLYVVIVLAVVGVLSWVQFSIRSLGNELLQTRADNTALANQVKALGGTPTVAPPPIKGISNDDVRAIVADEMTKSKITLTRTQVSQIAGVAAAMVPKPKDGVTPSSAQVKGVVSATITAFCAQSSKPCQGKPGPKGKDAPPITAAQLSAVVEAFCGADAVNCRGPRGDAGRGIKSITKSGETVTVTYTDDTTDSFTVPDGTPGATGPAGRGIAKTECQDDGDWLFTYTDGTTETVSGPCRVTQPTPPVPTESLGKR